MGEGRDVAATTARKDVFVSHASVDAALADAFVRLLRLGGVPHRQIVYTSSRETGVPTGAAFRPYLQRKLRSAGLVVQLISPGFLASQFCVLELGGQWALGRRSFPLAVPPLTAPVVGQTLGGLQVGSIDDKNVLAELRDALTEIAGVTLPTSSWNKAVEEFLAELPSSYVAAARSEPTTSPAGPRRSPPPDARYGPDRLFADQAPGRFATESPNRPALQLRAVWRADQGGEPLLRLSRVLGLTDLAPNEILDEWHTYYEGNGGVGGLWPAQLNAEMTNSVCAVVDQDCSRTEHDTPPEASARIAVVLLDGVPVLRFVVDLWLSVPTERLPLGRVLLSLQHAAHQATCTIPQWLAGQTPKLSLPGSGVLELHALGSGASVSGGPADSLDGCLDLSIMGRRSKARPIRLSEALALEDPNDRSLTDAITQAISQSSTDWGYFHAPGDLDTRLRHLLEP